MFRFYFFLYLVTVCMASITAKNGMTVNINIFAPTFFTCTVCYLNQCVALRTPCDHVFCAECIRQTLVQANQLCPYCRTTLPDDLQSYEINVYQSLHGLSSEQINVSLALLCATGNEYIVARYLPHVTNINALDIAGSSALYTTIAMGGSLPIVKLLVQHGANVTQSCVSNQSFPLLLSAQEGYFAIAEWLILHGANVNQVDGRQRSSLLFAARKNQKRMVDLLLYHHADINTPNDEGVTPLFISCEEGHIEVAELFLQNENVLVDKATDDGTTPLFTSCQKGHLGIVRLLLQYGAKVNQSRDNGVTPLYISAYKGNLEIARVLLQHEAEVNEAGNPDGESPLYIAVYQRNVAMVELLLQYGADVNQEDEYGKTPLTISEEEDYTEIMTLLLQHQ